MNSGLGSILARRTWFIPNLRVWGTPGLGEIDFVVAEQEQSQQSLLFGTSAMGESTQEVVFADLEDHRGNHLPATIDTPRVILRPRGPHTAFVVGQESDTTFRVARDSSATEPVAVDVLVWEMGS